MATIKQKRAARIAAHHIQQGNEPGEDVSWGKILRDAGYSESVSKKPKEVRESKGFKEIMSQVDDQLIIKRITEILMDENKREALKAADMLLKLKDRYPAGKVKVGSFKEKLGDIVVDEGDVEVSDKNEEKEGDE